MEGMKTFPDGYFDLALVDPPYGIGNFIPQTGKRTAGNFGAVAWNDAPPPPEYFAELRRVSKHQIIWGANYYNCFTGAAIIWDKRQLNPKLSRCEIASVSIGDRVAYVEIPWAGFIGTAERSGIHPCEKPVSLYKWTLDNYAKPGMRILDTHMGSGSIAIAAHYAGIHLTAFEIDADYFHAAKARIARETSQTELFSPLNS
jgi:site-specific DNA-methyltransferase (adenine-specific)